MGNIEFFKTTGNLTKEPINFKCNGHYDGLSTLFNDPNKFRWLWLCFLNDERCVEKIKIMEKVGINNPIDQAKQLIECNLIVLNDMPDIEENGKINFEYVDCAHKGANRHCPHSFLGNPKPFCIKKYKFS